MVSNPRATPANDAAKQWLRQVLASDTVVIVPEISDYEVRRELLRVGSQRGLARLDELSETLSYLPLTTAAMRLAADLWAQARRAGIPTAAAAALDCDVILAAQASVFAQPGEDVLIATANVAHLGRFFPARLWSEIE
jgi:predicted nucleic acid-binding protein